MPIWVMPSLASPNDNLLFISRNLTTKDTAVDISEDSMNFASSLTLSDTSNQIYNGEIGCYVRCDSFDKAQIGETSSKEVQRFALLNAMQELDKTNCFVTIQSSDGTVREENLSFEYTGAPFNQ